MAIKGLSTQYRALREAKFKLGYVKRGKSFPSDTDVFVGKVEDGITKRMIEAYGATPIPDAKESGVYDFGRELRGILKFDFDAKDADGREVTYESLNRAWGNSRIRCSGDGGDGGEYIGEAWVRDQRFKERLERAGLLIGARADGAGWIATCKGRDCPLWHSAATDADKTPSCHRETRFRFVLLTPTEFDSAIDLDAQAADYIKNLGWVEIATSSFHGTVDIQSGMRTIRAETGGETTFLPLKRVMRSISAPTGRVKKAPLMVGYDTDEVQVFAAGGGRLAQLRPGMRERLAGVLRAEAAVAALAPATYADVADIQPQPDRRALAAPRPIATQPRPDPDRDQVIEAGGGDPEDDEPGPARPPVAILNQKGRDELKRLCGGVEDANGRFSELERFRELVKASYEALGVPSAPPNGLEFIPFAEVPKGDRGGLEFLTTAHADWIVREMRSGEPGGDDRDPDDEA